MFAMQIRSNAYSPSSQVKLQLILYPLPATMFYGRRWALATPQIPTIHTLIMHDGGSRSAEAPIIQFLSSQQLQRTCRAFFNQDPASLIPARSRHEEHSTPKRRFRNTRISETTTLTVPAIRTLYAT